MYLICLLLSYISYSVNYFWHKSESSKHKYWGGRGSWVGMEGGGSHLLDYILKHRFRLHGRNSQKWYILPFVWIKIDLKLTLFVDGSIDYFSKTISKSTTDSEVKLISKQIKTVCIYSDWFTELRKFKTWKYSCFGGTCIYENLDWICKNVNLRKIEFTLFE